MTSPLICALDTADLGELGDLAAAVGPEVGYLKVGLQAFSAHGPKAVRVAAEHGPVFLDVKLHDIPNTVAGATAAAAGSGAAMLTVHASGGPAMIEAAVAAASDMLIIGVTVLTSFDDGVLAAVGQPGVEGQVLRLAALATDAGADGVVCAPPEVTAVRGALDPERKIVVPGVRPVGADPGDQARTGTPAATLRAGADFLVVGRPITTAEDPAAAARAIRSELP